MSAETCHTCEYDEHCDNIKRTVAELEQERDLLALTHETASEDLSELIILENMPLITPASAKRETGGRIGTRGDVHISLLSKKRGITVEKAAETIYQKYGPEGEGLLQPEFDEGRIRNEIIDILQMGKANYRAQFISPVAEKELDIVEKQQQFVEECVGDVPQFDLTEYEMAKALALAITMKYKYAA